MTRHRTDRDRRTHPLIWCVAIICTLIAIIVIISGVVIFVGYLFFRPRMPTLSITYAHLYPFKYDQAGILYTHLTIVFRAENNNVRAEASFSEFEFELSFHGVKIARLLNHPFDMDKNSTRPVTYSVESDYIPLDPNQMVMVQQSLAQNRAEFRLTGHSRTWWRVGPIRSPKFWINLDCVLQFRIDDGSTTDSSHCIYKVK
uniref:Late embryogenesis abundant protein LEA-2 subgroup domain-containing protein n=1 Tax=Opuntia streptacantha TaxID=393608 RepID=A0A7C8Z5T6_OPUST